MAAIGSLYYLDKLTAALLPGHQEPEDPERDAAFHLLDIMDSNTSIKARADAAEELWNKLRSTTGVTPTLEAAADVLTDHAVRWLNRLPLQANEADSSRFANNVLLCMLAIGLHWNDADVPVRIVEQYRRIAREVSYPPIRARDIYFSAAVCNAAGQPTLIPGLRLKRPPPFKISF